MLLRLKSYLKMLKNKNHTVIAFIKETTKVNQFLPSSVMFVVIFFFTSAP